MARANSTPPPPRGARAALEESAREVLALLAAGTYHEGHFARREDPVAVRARTILKRGK